MLPANNGLVPQTSLIEPIEAQQHRSPRVILSRITTQEASSDDYLALFTHLCRWVERVQGKSGFMQEWQSLFYILATDKDECDKAISTFTQGDSSFRLVVVSLASSICYLMGYKEMRKFLEDARFSRTLFHNPNLPIASTAYLFETHHRDSLATLHGELNALSFNSFILLSQLCERIHKQRELISELKSFPPAHPSRAEAGSYFW